jgi:hypothetical protein
VTESQSLLTILATLAEKTFQGIITGNESWFAHLIESEAVFAFSPVQVTLSISCKKSLLPFFHGKRPADFGCPSEGIKIQSG